MTSFFLQIMCLSGNGPLFEISTNINSQLEVTQKSKELKNSSGSGTFHGPPESAGARPAWCRLPPRSASDESFHSLASDKQHESSTRSETGNRYEQVRQMCKWLQWGNNTEPQKSQISGSLPPFQIRSSCLTVTVELSSTFWHNLSSFVKMCFAYT